MSVGDILTACAAWMLDGPFEFIFLYDPERPVLPVYRDVTPENFLDKIGWLLDCPWVCPEVTAVELRKGRSGGGYGYYGWNRKIADSGKLPVLSTGLKRDVEVSVNLRRSAITPQRNSNIGAWEAFFRNHADVQFDLIGDVPVELPNVRYHKDGLLNDLAVVENSAFHMGTVSGPCDIRRFSRNPYAVFGLMTGEYRLNCYDGERWSWAVDGQRWLRLPETLENIEREWDTHTKSRGLKN